MMKVYCDTSVLVASSVPSHPHYLQSMGLLKQVRAHKLEGMISAHGMAEFYAVITRAPITPPVFASEAWRLLERNILPHFRVAALSVAQYTDVLRKASERGWTGGMVYDALHIAAATSTHCERIYTWNVRHFLQLAPELGEIICSP